jgi:lipopolysaccharide export system permease protein
LNLIGRYIFRETLTATALVMAVLLVIFMSNQFAETLGDAAANALPRDAVFKVLGLQFFSFLSLLAPIGLLLGVLLALARLNRDSEMSALAACGVGPARLLQPILLLSVLVAGGVGWLALVRSPSANLAIEEIRFQAREDLELGTLTAGRFMQIDDNATVIYAREVDGNQLRGVFIQSESDDGIVVIVAEEGELVAATADGQAGLTLRFGKRYEVIPGRASAFIAEFGEHGIPIRLERAEFEPELASQSTLFLLASQDPVARAELEWRIAAPVSIVILTLLAVPLGRSSPREGKYARVGLGLLIYIIYANTLSIAGVWVERQIVPVWLGTWWVHALLALLALLMLARQQGFGAPQEVKSKIRHEPTG